MKTTSRLKTGNRLVNKLSRTLGLDPLTKTNIPKSPDTLGCFFFGNN